MSDKYTASAAHLKYNLKLLCLLFLLLIQQVSWAQVPVAGPESLLHHGSEKTDTTHSLAELPPEEVPASNNRFVKTAALLGAGAGVLAATYALVDEPLQQFSQSNRNQVSVAVARVVEPLGKPGHLAPVAGAAALGGILFKSPKLQKAGFISLGSVMASAVITNTLKQSFQRHRPSVTTENNQFDGLANGRNTSLPSAHTSTAFAMATSVATVYRDSKWVPPLAYGAATLVGLSRIHDNAHWATDVIAGAAIGYFTAKTVNRLYDTVYQRLEKRKQRLLLAPQVGLQSGSLSATLVF